MPTVSGGMCAGHNIHLQNTETNSLTFSSGSKCAHRYLRQNLRKKRKGQVSNTHPCEVNGVNVAATSPASLLSLTGAMADTPLVQTDIQGRKVK